MREIPFRHLSARELRLSRALLLYLGYAYYMGENAELTAWVDRLYEESDRRVFEVLHRIAALAVATTVEALTENE